MLSDWRLVVLEFRRRVEESVAPSPAYLPVVQVVQELWPRVAFAVERSKA